MYKREHTVTRNNPLLSSARHKATFNLTREELPIKISADEEDPRDAPLTRLPPRPGRPEVDLFVDSLKDELLVPLPRKRQDALAPVEIGGPRLQELGHEDVELGHVQKTFHAYAARRDHRQIVDLS